MQHPQLMHCSLSIGPTAMLKTLAPSTCLTRARMPDVHERAMCQRPPSLLQHATRPCTSAWPCRMILHCCHARPAANISTDAHQLARASNMDTQMHANTCRMLRDMDTCRSIALSSNNNCVHARPWIAHDGLHEMEFHYQTCCTTIHNCMAVQHEVHSCHPRLAAGCIVESRTPAM
jgi:hypothetical protein